MPGTSVEDLEVAVNTTLREALNRERSKNWPKVITCYRRLLRMLSKEHLPIGFKPPAWFSTLLYEFHYYLGLALQYDNQHHQAALQFGQAIKAITTLKNGCSAGCRSDTCLTTPVHTRKAFAHAVAGELREALCDAEQAVVLDNSNPDVYCVRALVRNTREEESLAIQDVEKALKLHGNHPCALILRGAMTAPLHAQYSFNEEHKKPSNADHIKACSINPDCRRFLGVDTFRHKEALVFYDRLLFSLTVPHIVSIIRFPVSPDVQGQRKKIFKSNVSINPSQAQEKSQTTKVRPGSSGSFRCGTPVSFEHAQTSLRRRKQYGEAIRVHHAKPKAYEALLAYLDGNQSWHSQWQRRNSVTSMKSRLSEASHSSRNSCSSGSSLTSVVTLTSVSVPSMCNSQNSLHHGTKSASSLASASPLDKGLVYSFSPRSQPFSRASGQSGDVKASDIQVFLPLNLDDVPRTYYRPWKGDTLPSSERRMKRWIGPPFK